MIIRYTRGSSAVNSFKHNYELMNMGAILLASAKWLCQVLPAQKEIEEEDMRNCWRHERKIVSES